MEVIQERKKTGFYKKEVTLIGSIKWLWENGT